jgi:TolA-binding protein
MFDATRAAPADPRYQAEAARWAVRAWEAEVTRQKAAGALARRGPPMPPALVSLVASTDALVARFPGDELAPGAAYRAAEVVHGYGDPVEARRRLEEVATRWPDSEAGKRSSRVVVDNDLASRFESGSEQLAQKRWSVCAATFRGIADAAPRHALADRALYNAAICEEADRHPNEASALLGRLIAEHASSPLAPDALLRQASIDEAASDFALAAERYQLLLEKYPAAKQARDALYNRARSLEALQRYGEAGLAFERHASLEPAAEASATLLHASEVFEKGEAWSDVVRTVQAYQRKRPPAGDPEQFVVSLVRLGRAEAARGRAEAARTAWTSAVSEFSRRKLDPKVAPVAARAAAEARFGLAEREVPRIEGAGLPATASPARLQKALEALRADVGRVSSQYEEVTRLGSPEWTVAALYRQGWLAARFARILEEAPVPPELAKVGGEQDLAAYRAQIQALARPYHGQAVEACSTAGGIARDHRVETAWSRAATELLEQERRHLDRAGGVR